MNINWIFQKKMFIRIIQKKQSKMIIGFFEHRKNVFFFLMEVESHQKKCWEISWDFLNGALTGIDCSFNGDTTWYDSVWKWCLL